ncbi:uncharacterized protein B0P05DRAFT_547351 [Gilbertella persicaria]|uniref:Extracellular membrane protein CFEM domain-containing protein n=1 Tax=Rhizopus stolonifer TaxID=4846 RepID=A0A367K1M3_RHIST|nr:uncharacterized protein B0P05DRAFT_547351 [Gilbertella persicaria]KAI8075396.1 hypothetical protein B0P05DRAFT_547351 [Gilbertella persicaria]RCH95791.1 hypothetical protein CU098_010503 [Rhizopus stolonifer]
MSHFIITLPFIVIYFVAVAQVGCRCICDPIDILCLENCVRDAHDCIIDCTNNDCFTNCINAHWPGATFEEAIEKEQQPNITINADSSIQTYEPTISSQDFSLFNTTMDSESAGTVFAPTLSVSSTVFESIVTTHTTVIRLTTVTPTLNTMSSSSFLETGTPSSSSASFRDMFDPSVLLVTVSLLIFTIYILA